ncbi:MAG TPA: hypothetical protein VLI69_02165 [Gammaproteobacteria bacterium]|nr:hypothetical protein [Gammaproteobacteria bacterium]
MNEIKINMPLKSVAIALLFCTFLGPVGVLYSSLMGGIVMIVLGLLVLRAKLFGPILLVWLISCVWGVAATNYFNKKVLQSQK